jgi:hypothetical protein
VVTFTPWPLYSRGKSPWYPLDKRLVGPDETIPTESQHKMMLWYRIWKYPKFSYQYNYLVLDQTVAMFEGQYHRQTNNLYFQYIHSFISGYNKINVNIHFLDFEAICVLPYFIQFQSHNICVILG